MSKTVELEVYREPDKGLTGGRRLVTVKLKHITTVEDTGDDISCLITLTNGRGFTVSMDYNRARCLIV